MEKGNTYFFTCETFINCVDSSRIVFITLACAGIAALGTAAAVYYLSRDQQKRRPSKYQEPSDDSTDNIKSPISPKRKRVDNPTPANDLSQNIS